MITDGFDHFEIVEALAGRSGAVDGRWRRRIFWQTQTALSPSSHFGRCHSAIRDEQWFPLACSNCLRWRWNHCPLETALHHHPPLFLSLFNTYTQHNTKHTRVENTTISPMTHLSIWSVAGVVAERNFHDKLRKRWRWERQNVSPNYLATSPKSF